MHDDRVPLANRRSCALAHPGELIARPKRLVIGPVKRAAISFLDGLLPADTLYPSLKFIPSGEWREIPSNTVASLCV